VIAFQDRCIRNELAVIELKADPWFRRKSSEPISAT